MDPKRYVIFGAPGAGKGTFCSRIVELFPHIKHVSTGDIFRENVKNETELGKKVKEFLDAGKLVPDEITNAIVKDKLEQLSQDSWILDGFPRTLSQAEFLSSHFNIDKVLVLDVPRDVIKKRILGRFSCPKCGKIYNKFTLPPKDQKGENEWICDNCGADITFVQRSDDTEEALEKRLDIYEKNAQPVLEYYEKKGKIVKIGTENTLELSKEEIMNILN
ncbi:MAG: adenylate kinase family protein [Promethearchaeota archaeon]